MSDDTRRPGKDDEKPTEPQTGEAEVVGADWLLSQLGSERTGEVELPRRDDADSGKAPEAPAEAGDPKTADKPVLAWWREKLVAADALINPDARQETPEDDDEPVLPEPGWTARSSSDRSEPALFGTRRSAPEPTQEPATPAAADPDDGIGADADGGWSLTVDGEPADEPETGLVPSADPPLFKPRSARDHVPDDAPVDAAAEPVLPGSPVLPDAARSGIEPAATIPTAAPVPPIPLPSPGPASPASDTDTDADGGDEDEDDDGLGNFSWGLTPNDQLDPLVHRQAPETETIPTTDAETAEVRAGEEPPARVESAPTAALPGVDEPRDASAPDEAAADAPLLPRRRVRRAQTAQQPVVVPVLPAGASADDVGAAGGPPATDKPARRRSGEGGGRPPRALILGAVVLVAVLVLAGLFYLGSRLPALLAGPAPSPTATATPTPTPTPTETVVPSEEPAAPVGPAAAGEQKWTALTGGECLDPYSTPWAETFTVVDCAVPHAAQMVFSAPVDADPAAAYPGEEAILSQIYLWCSAPGVLDAAAAGQYSDLQVQGSYPVTEEQWAAGERNYFCFVNRSSGEALTGSVAVPRA